MFIELVVLGYGVIKVDIIQSFFVELLKFIEGRVGYIIIRDLKNVYNFSKYLLY